MHIVTLIVSPFATNCYILGCEETNKAAVIDPGDNAESIIQEAASRKLEIDKILLTHGHTDHVSACKRVKDATGADVYIHQKDVPLLAEAPRMALMFGWSVGEVPEPDKYLEEGDKITVGGIELVVMHTPGHSPGGVCFKGDGFIFSGDTLFAGSIGRTDLPGGSYQELISMIKDKIMILPEDTQVLSGHGPATTVGTELRVNPFVGRGGGIISF
jgi:glyoxylase-like metal-dependent hydrolase (beta-lactamase superfamily II)